MTAPERDLASRAGPWSAWFVVRHVLETACAHADPLGSPAGLWTAARDVDGDGAPTVLGRPCTGRNRGLCPEVDVRPVITPAHRRLWRDSATLQIGAPEAPAVVLTGLREDTRALLGLLDGTRTRQEFLAAATADSGDASAGALLLELLEGAGLVEEAGELHAGLAGLPPTERDRLGPELTGLSLVHGPHAAGALRARRASLVQVQGMGRVGGALAALLVSSGVGTVDVRDPAPVRAPDVSVGAADVCDLGRPRADAARRRLRQLSASVHLSSSADPQLVVLADEPVPGQAELLRSAGVPHLMTRVTGRVAVVGPLVVPGLSACTACLDLTRADLDPGWPALAVQLTVPSRSVPAGAAALTMAAAAQAALQVLELLDGRSQPATVNGTLELVVPDWRWRRRSWTAHPGCACAWGASRKAG